MPDLDAIRSLVERRRCRDHTHWQGCEVDHIDCAVMHLLALVEDMEQRIRELTEDVRAAREACTKCGRGP